VLVDWALPLLLGGQPRPQGVGKCVVDARGGGIVGVGEIYAAHGCCSFSSTCEHLRINLTTQGLATLFDTSQSAVDRIIDHLVPVLARTLRPDPDTATTRGSSTAL